jgi:phage tail protein X
MPMTYRTRDGDILDEICAEHYGTENLGETVVAVFEANRDLADKGPIYTAGVIITLPDLAPPVAVAPIQLWD